MHKTTLFFLLLMSSFISYTQDKTIDSLKKVLQTEKEDTNKVNTLNELSYSLLVNQDYNNALQSADEASSLSETLEYKKGLAASSLRKGQSKSPMGRFDDAVTDLQVSLKLYQQIGDNSHVGIVYDEIIGDYLIRGFYAEAISTGFDQLKLYERLGDRKSAANTYQTIGALYMEQGNDSESLKNLQAGLRLRQEIKDSEDIGQSLASLGSEYSNLGNYSEAIKADSDALKIYTLIGNKAPFWGIALCKLAIGNNFEKLGDKADAANEKEVATDNYQKALENYTYALNFWIKYKDNDNIEGIYDQVGFAQIKLQHFPEAKESFLNALKLSEILPIKEEIKNIYNGLSIVDSANGDYKQAYEHYKKYIVYRDSLINEKSTKKTMQASMQHDFDKKEAVAKAGQEKKNAEARRIKNQQYFIIAVLGLIVLAVAVISLIQFRNNKQKKKANLLLERQKQKIETALADLKSTQSQLIQSEKMASLGELTAGIAHEIQNPLNFVNNFSDVNTELIDETGQEIDKGNIYEAKSILSDIKENEQKINHHGKRAGDIVKGMLQHSRTSTGIKEPTDINALCDEYLRLSYHGLRAKDKEFNATMKTDFDDSIGKINIIPQDIGRVLLNLYNNAFYAVQQKQKDLAKEVTPFEKVSPLYEPTVSITTRKSESHVLITVSDNGNGIPQNIVDKIFQPFFTTKPTGQGTGLGLSLSYDIVKAHGGEIKVETKEGEGSEFLIQFPLSIA